MKSILHNNLQISKETRPYSIGTYLMSSDISFKSHNLPFCFNSFQTPFWFHNLSEQKVKMKFNMYHPLIMYCVYFNPI